MSERDTATTDDSSGSSTDGPPAFEEGRYLFCAVRRDRERDGSDDESDSDAFTATGLEDRPAYLVGDDVALVVQRVESIYDSDDLTQVRRWLLTHQRVVDEAGNAFGTPLPFRFDTIVPGSDEDVIDWLTDHRETIDEALAFLDGRWEYRIEILWDESAVTEEITAEDSVLQDLDRRRESAGTGTAFMLEKQYERELRRRLSERREELARELGDALRETAVEVERQKETTSTLGDADTGDEDTVVRFSVLADRDREDDLGGHLDEIASRPNYEVRFTGPWPPYTYAPTIGEE